MSILLILVSTHLSRRKLTTLETVTLVITSLPFRWVSFKTSSFRVFPYLRQKFLDIDKWLNKEARQKKETDQNKKKRVNREKKVRSTWYNVIWTLYSTVRVDNTNKRESRKDNERQFRSIPKYVNLIETTDARMRTKEVTRQQNNDYLVKCFYGLSCMKMRQNIVMITNNTHVKLSNKISILNTGNKQDDLICFSWILL